MHGPDRIDELKKRYDENPRRFFASLANEHRKAGNLEQAIAICQAHLADQPANMNGHVVYGQSLFEAGRYDEAKTTFDAALALDPENLIALRHLGDIACTNGENDIARTWYARVLDADPRNEEIIALLAALDAEPGGTSAPAMDEIPVIDEMPVIEATPVARPTPVYDATPVVPLDAVKTLEVPAFRPPPPPRESIGLLDISLDFESTDDTQPADKTLTSAFDDDSVFPSFDDADVVAPVAEAEKPAEPPEPAQPEPPAAPFVTETMAELYLQQGFNAEALDVYRQLSAAAPHDEALKERIRNLEQVRPAEVRSAPGAATVRAYFAGLAARRAMQGNGRTPTPAPVPAEVIEAIATPSVAAAPKSPSLDDLFPGETIAPEDEQAALAFAQVAGAVEMGSASVRGKPTARASNELSLDEVFRAAEPQTPRSVSRQSQTLRFDQFFATGSDESELPAPPPGSSPTGEPGSPAELQQFQSWLTRLKKP